MSPLPEKNSVFLTFKDLHWRGKNSLLEGPEFGLKDWGGDLSKNTRSNKSYHEQKAMNEFVYNKQSA